jgi:hypothetical protein
MHCYGLVFSASLPSYMVRSDSSEYAAGCKLSLFLEDAVDAQVLDPGIIKTYTREQVLNYLIYRMNVIDFGPDKCRVNLLTYSIKIHQNVCECSCNKIF